jgi:hypothetical protein
MTTCQEDPSRDGESTGRRDFYEWWPRSRASSRGCGPPRHVAALVASLNGGADTTPSPSQTPPAGSGVPAPIAPSSSEPVTIDTPAGKEVPACLIFRGAAVLRAGRTLALGARRIEPPDPKRLWYFESYVKWTAKVGQSRWSSPRNFGSAPPQDYEVVVISIAKKALTSVLRAHGSDGTTSTWVNTQLPPGADVLERLTVTQIPAQGNCPP